MPEGQRARKPRQEKIRAVEGGPLVVIVSKLVILVRVVVVIAVLVVVIIVIVVIAGSNRNSSNRNSSNSNSSNSNSNSRGGVFSESLTLALLALNIIFQY